MKPKQPFYTEAFYSKPYVTVAILDQIRSEELDRDFEMYGSGEFFYMSAFDSPVAREILSGVISDIDAYNEYYKGAYSEPTPGTICLNGLKDEHHKHFGNEEEIMWDEERNAFFSARAFHSEEDEYELN